MRADLLTYKDIIDEYGLNPWFWRTKQWEGKLKNLGFKNKHQFARQDIENLIQKLKQAA